MGKLTPAQLREARSKAGKKSHATGRGHEWDSKAASRAGKKGAAARAAKAKKARGARQLPGSAPAAEPNTEPTVPPTGEADIHGEQ